MSDLLIGLIVLGACIIAGVLIYNWTQEKRLRKHISEEFIVPKKDVLVEDFYLDTDAYVEQAFADTQERVKFTQKLNEPAEPKPVVKSELPESMAELADLAEQALPSTQDMSFKDLTRPPELDVAPVTPLSQEDEADAALMLKSQLPSDVHPQVDLTAFLFANKPMDGQSLYKTADAIASDMGIPMMLHGIDEHHHWHVIHAGITKETYKQAACSIQLANRAGPASKHVINKFQFAVENMGLQLAAHVEWQGVGDAAQRAIQLDEFCLEVDQIVSVHLVGGDTPIHGTKFRGLAEANGLVLTGDGKFELVTSNGKAAPLFTLSNAENRPFTMDTLRSGVIKGATFQLEIPKVSHCDQVFVQMMSVAQKMANSLSATLVDDNQRQVGDLQVEKIRAQLKVIHATMVARGIMPGSPSALRLFS